VEKYILIKCQSGVNGINSCYFSGMTLEDIYYLFGAPEELLVTYNEFDNFYRLKRADFLEFIQNRRDYYDIVCSDISTDIAYKEITKQDIGELQRFTDINTPVPVLWLPKVTGSFCIYSHDESLYSYLCFRIKTQDFVNSFLNWLTVSLTNETKKHFEQTDVENFLRAIQKGIYIDTEFIEIINDTLYISAGCFDSRLDFNGNLYSENFPKFEYIQLRKDRGRLA